MCEMEGQLNMCDLGIWSGKMSPELSAAETQKDQTSKPSLKKSSELSAKKPPLFLSLKRDGLKPGASAEWVTADAPFPSPGEYTTPSFGEFPREENASRLSQILEDSPLPKYSLSAKACQGILNRAERRGKKLPERLEAALVSQAGAGFAGYGETGIGYWQNGIQTLRAEGENRPSRPSNVIVSVHAKQDPTFVCAGFKHKASGTAGGIGFEEEKAPSMLAGQESAVYDARGNGDGDRYVVTSSGTNVVDTLDASYYKGTGSRTGKERTVLCVGNGQLNQMSMAEQANTLDTMHDQQAVMVAAVDCRNGVENGEINGTLQAKEQGQNLNSTNVCRQGSVVRRLTPLECERLQGYPDGWTDIGEWADSKGKKHKEADSPRYKALGNSIALPFWAWIARRICAQYERPATMASLFDGIGGFPLVFERCGAKAVWASEIEEFPIAVTKKHFPEEDTK